MKFEVFNKRNKLIVEAEKMGKVWVVWNYNDKDRKDLFELENNEMSMLIKEYKDNGFITQKIQYQSISQFISALS